MTETNPEPVILPWPEPITCPHCGCGDDKDEEPKPETD